MIAPREAYHGNPPETLVAFDFRVFGARPRFNREKKAWGHHATVERLDKYHAVLVVRTGGAREIAR